MLAIRALNGVPKVSRFVHGTERRKGGWVALLVCGKPDRPSRPRSRFRLQSDKRLRACNPVGATPHNRSRESVDACFAASILRTLRLRRPPTHAATGIIASLKTADHRPTATSVGPACANATRQLEILYKKTEGDLTSTASIPMCDDLIVVAHKRKSSGLGTTAPPTCCRLLSGSKVLISIFVCRDKTCRRECARSRRRALPRLVGRQVR
jgi:hypothetical protein